MLAKGIANSAADAATRYESVYQNPVSKCCKGPSDETSTTYSIAMIAYETESQRYSLLRSV